MGVGKFWVLPRVWCAA